MIRLIQVALRYGHNGVAVLNQLDLHVPPGAFVVLTGQSGAGKSSLLRLIFLEHLPSLGQVVLFGRDTALLNRSQRSLMRRQIGVVFQDFRLVPHLSLRENVALPLRIAGLYDRRQAGHVDSLLDWVGLRHAADALPMELSGGAQQRAAIARAVIARPSLLLADEPTASVDPAMSARLLHLFKELHRGGTTLVLATHDPQLTRDMPASLLRLENGQLRA